MYCTYTNEAEDRGGVKAHAANKAQTCATNPLFPDARRLARLKTLYAGSESLQRFRF